MNNIVTLGVVRDFGRMMSFDPGDSAYIEKIRRFGYKQMGSLPENDKEFYIGTMHKSWLLSSGGAGGRPPP